MTQFIFFSSPWLLPVTILIVLALSIEVPFRFARALRGSELGNDDAWNTIQAGLLTLAAFVIGLSFAQAAARYDARRALVVQEANAIGTTWLRADQLPGSDLQKFRGLLTDYTVSRLKTYETLDDPVLLRQSAHRDERDQAELWSISSSALRDRPTDQGRSLLMQTLNDTIDVSGEQLAALTTHVPTVIVFLAIVLLVLGTLATGVRFARDGSRPVVLSAIFVVACAVVVSMVVDYDRPQSGFVKIDLTPLRMQLQSMRGG